ncbi:MAG: hypothetical protein G3H99_00475 [Ferrovum sp.]|nr:hypothetical protein [Ferrovum sp.]NDU87751.1 hypothetical protein [Ferrovum sp.]
MTPWTLLTEHECGACLRPAFVRLARHLPAQNLESVLHASLQRMTRWVMNLPAPIEERTISSDVSSWLLYQAVEKAQSGVRDEVDGSLKLSRILAILVETLHTGILFWKVSAPDDAVYWGGFGSGLTRWSEGMHATRVMLEPQPRPPGYWLTPACLAGRILAGEAWHHLESLGVSGAVPNLTVHKPNEVAVMPHHEPTLRALHSLLERRVWRVGEKPGQLWRDDLGWMFLYPLAVADICREMCRLWPHYPALSPEQGLQNLRMAELVVSGDIERIHHPVFHRSVAGVRVGCGLQQWLDKRLSW